MQRNGHHGRRVPTRHPLPTGRRSASRQILALVLVVLSVVVAHSWLGRPSGAWESPAPSSVSLRAPAGAVSAVDRPARATPHRGPGWKQIVTDDRTPARASERQPHAQQLLHLLVLLLPLRLALLARHHESVLARHRRARARAANRWLSRAPPPATA